LVFFDFLGKPISSYKKLKGKLHHKIKHDEILTLGFWSLLSRNAKLVYHGNFGKCQENR
jgi:hypothetical protein